MCVSVSGFHQHWFSKLKGNKYIKKEIPKTIFVDARDIVKQLRTSVTAPNDPYLIFNSPSQYFYGGSLLAVTPATVASIPVDSLTHTHSQTYSHTGTYGHTHGHKCTHTQTQTHTQHTQLKIKTNF